MSDVRKVDLTREDIAKIFLWVIKVWIKTQSKIFWIIKCRVKNRDHQNQSQTRRLQMLLLGMLQQLPQQHLRLLRRFSERTPDLCVVGAERASLIFPSTSANRLSLRHHHLLLLLQILATQPVIPQKRMSSWSSETRNWSSGRKGKKLRNPPTPTRKAWFLVTCIKDFVCK